MNVGLVARADDRGIGVMTLEFFAAMNPARTIVVREPGAEQRGFPAHPDRYGDAPVVVFDPKRGELPERAVREFLDGLDVVYLVETPYDFRFFEWAREHGVTTVLHAMPEFWRWHEATQRPDVWWLPTRWRAELLPGECRVVEVPCPTPPPGVPSRSTAERVRFVHVAGHRAVGDRNGTLVLLQALRRMSGPCDVVMHTQDDRLPRVHSTRGVAQQIRLGGVVDRFSLFDDADVLVLPRRYGGLCLPVLEAMACGLGVVMSDVEPQSSTWPIMPVSTGRGRSIEMPCGTIVLHDTSPNALATRLDRLAARPDEVAELQRRSSVFARQHSWSELRGVYVDELQRACDDRRARVG